MKIRHGFVSNSSSSSFILAMPKNSNSKKIDFVIEGNLSQYVEETLKTKKDVIAYFKDNLCCENDDEDFIKTLKAIDDGYIIMIGSLSDESSDDPIQAALCYSESDDIKLKNTSAFFIQKAGGY